MDKKPDKRPSKEQEPKAIQLGHLHQECSHGPEQYTYRPVRAPHAIVPLSRHGIQPSYSLGTGDLAQRYDEFVGNNGFVKSLSMVENFMIHTNTATPSDNFWISIGSAEDVVAYWYYGLGISSTISSLWHYDLENLLPLLTGQELNALYTATPQFAFQTDRFGPYGSSTYYGSAECNTFAI